MLGKNRWCWFSKFGDEVEQCESYTCHEQLWKSSYIFSARITVVEEFYVERWEGSSAPVHGVPLGSAIDPA